MSTDYHVQDHSMLLPSMKRYIWQPLLPLIPAHVSANTLTLTGTLFSSVAFAITVLVPATRLSCAVIAVLVFCYLTLDNIDGAHARRTGTSSPLGEFLDHWLDALNSSFLFIGAIHSWHIPAAQAVSVMALAVLSYTMTFWEQRVTGRIHMAALGNVEGIVTVILFYVAGVIFGPEQMINTELVFGMTVIDFFWLSAVLSTAWTTIGPIVRVHSHYREVFEILAPVCAVIVWYAMGRISPLHACTLLTLLCPALAGRMLIARVTQRLDLRPDRALFAMIAFAAGISYTIDAAPNLQSTLLTLIIFYAVAVVTLDFFMTVRRLGEHLRPGELLSVTMLFPRG